MSNISTSIKNFWKSHGANKKFFEQTMNRDTS